MEYQDRKDPARLQGAHRFGSLCRYWGGQPNTDTYNLFGVLLVHVQGLAGADIPHPEWWESVLEQWKRSGSEKPGRFIKRAGYGGIATRQYRHVSKKT